MAQRGPNRAPFGLSTRPGDDERQGDDAHARERAFGGSREGAFGDAADERTFEASHDDGAGEEHDDCDDGKKGGARAGADCAREDHRLCTRGSSTAHAPGMTARTGIDDCAREDHRLRARGSMTAHAAPTSTRATSEEPTRPATSDARGPLPLGAAEVRHVARLAGELAGLLGAGELDAAREAHARIGALLAGERRADVVDLEVERMRRGGGRR